MPKGPSASLTASAVSWPDAPDPVLQRPGAKTPCKHIIRQDANMFTQQGSLTYRPPWGG